MTTATKLHVCVLCQSPLVYPVRWESVGHDGPVSLVLRCPECEFRRAALVSYDDAWHFETVLNDGTDAMIDALEAMERTHMEEDLQQLVRALQADAVTAFDLGGAP